MRTRPIITKMCDLIIAFVSLARYTVSCAAHCARLYFNSSGSKLLIPEEMKRNWIEKMLQD